MVCAMRHEAGARQVAGLQVACHAWDCVFHAHARTRIHAGRKTAAGVGARGARLALRAFHAVGAHAHHRGHANIALPLCAQLPQPPHDRARRRDGALHACGKYGRQSTLLPPRRDNAGNARTHSPHRRRPPRWLRRPAPQAARHTHPPPARRAAQPPLRRRRRQPRVCRGGLNLSAQLFDGWFAITIGGANGKLLSACPVFAVCRN